MLRRCLARWCAFDQQNFTTLSNKKANAEERTKASSASKGIPQRVRTEMKRITILHESPRCFVVGRNRCNNFNGNQYAIVSKKTQEAIMIDCGDDWVDDWVAYFREAGLKLKMVFFTHLHIDNLLGVNPLVYHEPRVGLAWSLSDIEWLDRFQQVCARYGRTDIMDWQLPFMRGPLWGQSPQHANESDLLLSSTTTRSESFFELGNMAMFYIATPGHSMGHTILHVPQEKLLFTGDLLFYDDIGRVDIPFGSGELLAQSLRMLEQLPDNTMLLPGHGRLSSLGRERRFNRGFQRVYEQLAAGKQVPNVGNNDHGWF